MWRCVTSGVFEKQWAAAKDVERVTYLHLLDDINATHPLVGRSGPNTRCFIKLQ